MARAFWKIATFVLSFALAAALVVAGAEWALRVSELAPVMTCVNLMTAVTRWHDNTARDYGHERVALLGDSKLMAPPGHMPLPATIEEALRHRGRRASRMKIHAFQWPGLGVSGHYSLADAVMDTKPSQIVLELNLQLWGPEPPGIMAFSELAGLIEGPRLWEAAWLPMAYTGITLNRLLFYRLLIKTGLYDFRATLSERQARIFKLREPFERWLEWRRDAPEGQDIVAWRTPLKVASIAKVLRPGRLRSTKEHTQIVLGNVLRGLEPSEPRARILKALLEDYRRAGIPTLVWATPLNLDYLRFQGFSLDGVERSVAMLRSIVEGSGASFLDFHARFPDAVFYDSGDHFKTDGDPDAGQVLGTELASAISRMAAAPDTRR